MCGLSREKLGLFGAHSHANFQREGRFQCHTEEQSGPDKGGQGLRAGMTLGEAEHSVRGVLAFAGSLSHFFGVMSL
jgi:hypothetical protein